MLERSSTRCFVRAGFTSRVQTDRRTYLQPRFELRGKAERAGEAELSGKLDRARNSVSGTRDSPFDRAELASVLTPTLKYTYARLCSKAQQLRINPFEQSLTRQFSRVWQSLSSQFSKVIHSLAVSWAISIAPVVKSYSQGGRGTQVYVIIIMIPGVGGKGACDGSLLLSVFSMGLFVLALCMSEVCSAFGLELFRS
jgi:hypothetical protein